MKYKAESKTISWLTFLALGWIMMFFLQASVFETEIAIKDLALIIFVFMQLIVGFLFYYHTPSTGTNSESALGIILSSFLGYGLIALIRGFQGGLLSTAITGSVMAITIVATYEAIAMSTGEELFHRVTIPKWFSYHSQDWNFYTDPAVGSNEIISIFMAGLVFGFYHFAVSVFNPAVLPSAIAFGLCQSVSYEITGSFLGLVYGHALWNLSVWGYSLLPLIAVVILSSLALALKGRFY